MSQAKKASHVITSSPIISTMQKMMLSTGNSGPRGVRKPRGRLWPVTCTGTSEVYQRIALPKRTTQFFRGNRFDRPHHDRECRLLAQRHQPMQMVGHYHEGQGIGPAQVLLLAQGTNQNTGRMEIAKDRLPIPRYRRNKIDLPGLRIAPFAQIFCMWRLMPIYPM